MFLWFNETVTAYWKHLSSLFFGFIVDIFFFNHLGESLFDPFSLKLSYKIGNAVNQHYQKQIHSPSLILLSPFDVL